MAHLRGTRASTEAGEQEVSRSGQAHSVFRYSPFKESFSNFVLNSDKKKE